MASLALGIVGAGVGFLVGGPAGGYLGAKIGFAAGILIGGVAFPPKGPHTDVGRIDDVRMSGSGYGVMIPMCYGRCRVGGNFIHARRLIHKVHTEEQGGKGGGGASVTNHSYFFTGSLCIASGVIGSIVKIYADDLVIYNSDRTPPTRRRIHFYGGAEDQPLSTIIQADRGVNTSAYRGMSYIVFDRLPLKSYGNRIPTFQFIVDAPTREDGTTHVSDIIADQFQRAGLLPSQYDVSAADGIVTKGFVIAQRQDVLSNIEPLLQVYSLDLIEVDGIIKVVVRGGPSEWLLTTDDLGAYNWGDSQETATRLTSTRIQDMELPRKIEVGYFQWEKDEQQGTQQAIRVSKGDNQDVTTVNTPLTLDKNTARRTAEQLLYQAWAERTQFAFLLGPRWLKIAPADVLTIPTALGQARVRVTSIDMALFGPVAINAILDDPLVYQQSVNGDGDTSDDAYDDSTTLGWDVFSTNALLDRHADSVGVYAWGSGGDSWSGLRLYYRRRGDSYRKLGELTEAATFGVALTVLPPPTIFSTGTFDDQTLQVELSYGTLESTSLDDVLSGANAIRIGDEVIQFTTATPIGINQYELSGLLRGQRGTDYYWSSHYIGEPVLLLDRETIKRFELPRNLIGHTVLVKVLEDDQELSEVTARSILIGGAELKPYSPSQLHGVRDPGTGDITVTWNRRVRKDGELQDGSDVDLDEWDEVYHFLVMADDFSVLIREMVVTGVRTYLYTAAQQTVDFGAPHNPVNIQVLQMGDRGRMGGFESTIVV